MRYTGRIYPGDGDSLIAKLSIPELEPDEHEVEARTVEEAVEVARETIADLLGVPLEDVEVDLKRGPWDQLPEP